MTSGRVEVCKDGEWQTLCAQRFNSKDATVVCRELGFSDEGIIPNSSPIAGLLDYVSYQELVRCILVLIKDLGGRIFICSIHYVMEVKRAFSSAKLSDLGGVNVTYVGTRTTSESGASYPMRET